MNPLLRAVQPDAEQLRVVVLLVGVAGYKVHAVAGGAEVRICALPGNPRAFTSGNGDPINARFDSISVRGQETAADLAIDDFRTVGREHGIYVMPRLQGDRAPLATSGGHHPDAPQGFVVPGYIDDRLPVAGPRRHELKMLVIL